MKKRIVACLAAAVSLSTLFIGACENGIGTAKNQQLKIWSAPSYIKVMQEIDYSQEDEFQMYYNNEAFEVFAFRNEKEGGQLLLSSSADVDAYNLQLSDLKTQDGKVFSKDAVAVYHMKYVDVTLAAPSMTVATIGMNPDALIPLEKAIEYKENKIKGSENQGIYIEYNTKDVEEGVYTGNYTVTIDGKSYSVPVKVTVWGAEVSSKNNLRTSFVLRNAELLKTELDSSDKMYYRYFDDLLDYRINCSSFNYRTYEEYAELLRKYYHDERVTTINLPKFENGNWTNYDFTKLESHLNFISELCFEDKVDYYSKMYYYLSIIDEPHITNTEGIVVPVYKNIAVKVHEHVRKLRENRANYDVSDELFESIIYDIENIEWVCTSVYREDFIYENNKSDPENPDEEYTITWVPPFDGCNTPSSRLEHVNENLEEWWYGCNWPGDPYPTYHLDDKVFTARVCSWMQYNYNITGNLYWRVNYGGQESSLGVSEPLEDPYDVTNQSQKDNGEGWIVYPGKPYGLDSFVPSLRLIAIRDGMEDYEVLKATGDICKEIAALGGYTNYDPNTTFSSLYASLYQGAKIIGDENDLTVSREMLAQLANFAAKGTVIVDVENKLKSTAVKVFAKAGTIKVNGAEPSYVAKEGGKEYTIEIVQNKTENCLSFALELDGQSYDFEMSVGGKKAELDVQKITYAGLPKNSNTVTSTKLENGVEVKFSESPTKQQVIKMSGSEIQNVLKKGVTSIQIEIDNPSAENFELEIGYVGEKSPIVYKMATKYNIENGSTMITVSVGTLDWNALRSIKELRFYMTFEQMQERSLTVKSISVAY